jgi:ATP-dependent RNA helicase RhlE
MTFNELNISEPVLKALKDQNYTEPTPIQQQAIPVATKGEDVLGIAQTGTGKTAAFAIPIIEQLKSYTANKRDGKTIKALILTPTRELAIQIEESFADYGKYTNLHHAVIFGGVNQSKQVAQLKQGVDILTATPGRLLDLIGQGIIHLDGIRHFVLDEADRMLDMGFIHDIRRILPMLPKNKQTMLFSATMPAEITKISKSLLKSPVRIEVAPESSVVDTIEQHVCYVEKPLKMKTLVSILNKENKERVLVFSRTKHGADRIARTLNKNHIQCGAIHGNKSQNARQKVLGDFKAGKTMVIVATDIAARGIDIHDLGVVINYDLPDVAETYVHRIGRTGRAGNSGMAFSLCSQEEFPMLKSIQKLTGKRIRETKITA